MIIEKTIFKKKQKTHVKDFETGNVEYTDEVDSLLSSGESFITLLHQPLEDTIEHGLCHSTDRVGHLILVPTLGYKLVTDLDLGLGKVLVQVSAVHTEKLGNGLTSLRRKWQLRLEYPMAGRDYHQIRTFKECFKKVFSRFHRPPQCRRLQPVPRDLSA